MAIKTKIREFLRKPSVWLCRVWPNTLTIAAARRCNHIQLSVSELELIIRVINSKPDCNMLVFGAGNDSMMWTTLNNAGLTYFIEDNPDWVHTVEARDNIRQIITVEYQTKRTQWKALLDSPDQLQMELPDEINRQKWDVVLVDAPAGWHDDSPGRMKSIYQASCFIRASVDIFVHDCNRQIEREYCDKFLKPQNLMCQIDKLRQYHY